MRLPDHRLVFVGGLHRSGTTPLARCLGAHQQVSAFADTGAKEDEGQHLQSVYPAAQTYGGAGRFALAPAAHLTESSALATEDSARRLFDEWRPYWDLTQPVLVEKSPPNLVMTRFLQQLYPESYMVMVVRHPVVVSLSTIKWSGGSLHRLMENWFAAHEIFRADAPHLRHVHTVSYESLVREPERALAGIASFLDLDGPIPADSIQGHRSQGYEQRWHDLAHSSSPWRRRTYRQIIDQYADRAQGFGYDLRDLDLAQGFPIAG